MTQAAPARSLWQRAPLWRYCCYFGAVLTVLVVALPYLHAPETAGKPAVEMVQKSPVPVQQDQRIATASESSTVHQHAAAESNISAMRAPVSSGKNDQAAVVKTPAISDNAHTGHQAKPMIAANGPNNSPDKELAPVEKQPNTITIPLVSGAPNDLDGFLQALDASAQEVKTNCLSSQNREPSRSNKPGTTQVHLASDGVWCFFEATRRLYSVRIEDPFSGTVDGIRIGDSLDKVKAVLGEPLRQWPFADKEAYLFQKHAKTFDRFDVSDGVVRTIFIGKR